VCPHDRRARKAFFDKNAGVGTVVAMMLPYTAVVCVVWTIFFFARYLLGIPFWV